MLRWLFVGLLLIPLLDIVLLIYIGGIIGAPATVLLVVLTGLIGLILVRAEGRHTLMRLQRKLLEGSPPTDELLDGGLLIAAGAFLLTPGLVTDVIGFLLVIPPTRLPVRHVIKRYILIPAMDNKSGGFVTGNVYTFGFPNDQPESDDSINIDGDSYHIDIDDDDPK